MPINSEQPQRAQSMTSAGQAAAMALRLHSSPQKSQQQQPQQRTAAQTQYARAQSLTSGRSNSMRQYTYNPKPSYVPGNASIPNARRYNSLTSASRVNYNSNVPTSPLQHQYTQIHEENEGADEEEIIITTTTTKVVDSQGRTTSLTTKTVKTLPDGSNIIETTTKNISRTNSRANSLNSGTNYRSGSLTRAANINLSKIDEDLQNFEYDYQVDNPALDNPETKLMLNLPDNSEQQAPKELGSPFLASDHPITAVRSDSLNSQGQPKPLRSILKNSQVPIIVEKPASPSKLPLVAAAAAASVTSSPRGDIRQQVVESDDSFKSPISRAPISPVSLQSPNKSRFSRVPGSPNQRIGGSPPSSIRFNEKVQTIPVYNEDSDTRVRAQRVKVSTPSAPAKTKQQTDADLYAAAMKAAMKKVYGDRDPNQQAAAQESVPTSKVAPEEPKKMKLGFIALSPRDKSHHERKSSFNSETENVAKTSEESADSDATPAKAIKGSLAQEVPPDYEYVNHHREFVTHSLRGDNKGSTRKDRVKEEKRKAKEAAKEQAQEEKRKAKEQAEEEKIRAKEAAIEEERLAKEKAAEDKRVAKEQADEEKRKAKELKKEKKKFGFFSSIKRRTSTASAYSSGSGSIVRGTNRGQHDEDHALSDDISTTEAYSSHVNDSSVNPVLNSVTSVSDDLTEVQPPKIEKRPEISKKEDIPSNTEKLNKLAETKEVELEKLLEDDLAPEADVTQKDTADVLVEKPDNTEDNFGSVVIDDELYQVSIPRNARFSDGHEMEPSEGMYLTEKSHNEAYPLPNIVGSSPVINTSSNDKLPLPIDEQHTEDANEVFHSPETPSEVKADIPVPELGSIIDEEDEFEDVIVPEDKESVYENSEPEVIDEEAPHLESVETDRSPAHIDSDPNVANSYSKQVSEPINNTPTVEASPGADYELALINQQTDTEREQDLQTEHLREPEKKVTSGDVALIPETATVAVFTQQSHEKLNIPDQAADVEERFDMDEHSSAPPSSDSLPGTNSTKATENSPQDDLVVENKTNPPKKPSKFKQKILKYFVNSYDKI